jgi:parallel beta-helix repeat protein
MFVPLTVAGLIAAASVPAWGAVASTPPPKTLTVYMSPANKAGSDKHTGLSTSSPILTLARAQQVLSQQKPKGNVVIKIEQGTYVAGSTTWSYYVPGHTISFQPANYVAGHGRPAGGDPAFVNVSSKGQHPANTWLHAELPGTSSSLHNGGNVGLQFHYLLIEDYTQGINLDGQTGHGYHNDAKPAMYTKPSAGLNDVSVSGMTFSDIGDRYAPGYTGYGAILFTDSSGDSIVNNTFHDIYNTGDTDELHGLYITHFSSDNTISKNVFENTNGEAVKVRDRSDNNTVSDNRFINTGGVSAYLDDFCDEACAAANEKPPVAYQQCASYGNHFVDNTVESNNFTDLIPSGETYAGGAGCSIPKGQERLYSSGNKR